MISGPDLGGGYLHQLTFEDDEPTRGFVHHVQDGGDDAGGPPPGPPAPFGFERFPGMCQYGGVACWHRGFDLPNTAANDVRMAYNRWRFVSASLLAQEYRNAARPVEASMKELVDRLTQSATSSPFRWFIGGSAALWLRGMAIGSRDIDVGTDPPGGARIAAALREFLIEPFGPTNRGPRARVVGGRAFVGTLAEGTLVEWSAPTDPSDCRGSVREWADHFTPQLVEWSDRRVPVSPPEYAVIRFAERGAIDRIHAAASRGAGGTSWNTERLSRLLDDRTVPQEARTVLVNAFPTLRARERPSGTESS